MTLSSLDGLEARIFWGDTLLATTFRQHPKTLTVGDSEACDLHLPGLELPLPCFPIVETVGNEMQLVFSPGMEGELQLDGEPPRALRALIGSLEAYPQGDIEGCYAVSLPRRAFAHVDLAGLRLELQVKPMPRKLMAPFWETLDYPWLNTLLLFGFVVLVLTIAAATMPLDVDVRGDDLIRNAGTLARYLPPPARARAWRHEPSSQAVKEAPGTESSRTRSPATAARGRRAAPASSAVEARETARRSAFLQSLDSGTISLIA